MGKADLGSWNAAFGPRSAEVWPKPLWDGKTGKMDRSVLEHWKKYEKDRSNGLDLSLFTWICGPRPGAIDQRPFGSALSSGDVTGMPGDRDEPDSASFVDWCFLVKDGAPLAVSARPSRGNLRFFFH